MTPDTVLLHLSLIDGIGAGTIKYIIDNKHPSMSWESCYHWKTVDWHHNIDISLKQAERLVTGLADRAMLEKELHLVATHAINWISILDPDYPQLLKQIRYPPI